MDSLGGSPVGPVTWSSVHVDNDDTVVVCNAGCPECFPQKSRQRVPMASVLFMSSLQEGGPGMLLGMAWC